MEQLSFIESFRTSPFILTEGAIVERLRHEFHISPDKHIAHAALIYDAPIVRFWHPSPGNTCR